MNKPPIATQCNGGVAHHEGVYSVNDDHDHDPAADYNMSAAGKCSRQWKVMDVIMTLQPTTTCRPQGNVHTKNKQTTTGTIHEKKRQALCAANDNNNGGAVSLKRWMAMMTTKQTREAHGTK